MKRVKGFLLAVVLAMFYSCSKSDYFEPVPMQDNPHKKDTMMNNFRPRILL